MIKRDAAAAEGKPRVFVVGDAAHAIDRETGEPVPGVAQGAIQTGRFVAEIIRRDLQGIRPQDRPGIRYEDKGSMATIGRGRAVVSLGKIHFGGLLGWIAWGGLHVLLLVGFQAKVFVFLSWIRNYFFADRRVRLITGDPETKIKQPRGARLLGNRHGRGRFRQLGRLDR